MRYFNPALALTGALFFTACQQSGQDDATAETAAQQETPVAMTTCPTAGENGEIEIQEGLTARITKTGYGRAAVSKDYADVHTTLWLYDAAAEVGRGTQIWASGGVDPFQFQIDAGQVIEGWDLGVTCMLIGEKRELRIAPELGYGARGKPPVPPNATLLFEIELVNLKSPE